MTGGKKTKGSENIRVAIRCRDLLPPEIQAGAKQAVRMDLATNQVIVQHAIGDPDTFAFDAVFNNSFQQKDIFLQEVQPLVEAVLQGYNATVFAYGQSGSGKTFTMTGDLSDKRLHGMMPQAVEYLFQEVGRQTNSQKQFKVKVSYVELYLGKSRDLLAEKQVNLEIKQNLSKNFFVKGAEVIEVLNFEDCMRVFNEGTVRRQVASTGLNDQSSRSHSLFMITVDQYDFEQDPSTPVIISSKLNLVDLAGSEKLSKTNATGDTAKEGCQINLSLSSLATVIDTIVKGGKHIPYRSSSLTMLLKDSLGGNSKTVMFANLGPSDRNVSETISTLRFAERAKQIKNQPVKNLDPKDARIAELLEKIEELQARLGNVDLNVEEQLKSRIEELEVENAQLRGNTEKDTLHLEEEMKTLAKQVEDLNQSLKQKEGEMNSMAESKAIMEANFKTDLASAEELRSIATNFIRRICNDDQIALIRSKIPSEVLEQGQSGADQRGWTVRELQYYFEGFVELFEAFKQTAFTEADLQSRLQAAKNDLQSQATQALRDLERQNADLRQQLEATFANRATDTEAQSQLKVEMTHLKEENVKLKEKIERDQEKFKKKFEKQREEGAQQTEALEQAKADLATKDREIEKLKALLAESGAKSGFSSATSGGGPAGNWAPEDRQKLLSQLEEAQLKASKFETRVKETNLMLRRKGICVKPNSAVAVASGIPLAPEAPDGESQGDENNDAFILANADDADAVDGDLVTQLQQQIRVQHRLHELRHTQQRKLDDLVRKFELLKTGTVTPTGSVGSISEEVLAEKVKEALAEKEKEIAELKNTHEQTTDKLVKKINKKLAEFKEKETAFADEKQTFEEERAELNAQIEKLSQYNTKIAVEVESLRTKLIDQTSASAADGRTKDGEIAFLKKQIEDLRHSIEEQRVKVDDYANLQQEHQRLQQQQARTEASLKEKITSLDNNRQMIKWSNSLLEAEKKKVTDLETEARKREVQVKEMEESWRAQMIENANKLVAINNKRLEEQAAQYQALIGEEQEKQKQLRKKLKTAKEQTQKAAQRYDEMVLENESLQTQYEELKVSAMKLYRQQRDREEDRYGTAYPGRKGL
jgi:DNA repair exonuclease SbcCD ATPase subunit